MELTAKNILKELQDEILKLEGFKRPLSGIAGDLGLECMKRSFPTNCFPVGAVHEFLHVNTEGLASTSGFIACLLSSLMRKGEVSVWIRLQGAVFPPALKAFDVDPAHIIFIDLRKQKDILWITEETLKCDALAAVVCEIQELGFTASRRLQLAVEQSRVTGFIIRPHQRNLTTTACVSRWNITSIPSALDDNMPGVGFPRWNVELLKMRNGKPGIWQMEWVQQKFREVQMMTAIQEEQKRKTG